MIIGREAQQLVIPGHGLALGQVGQVGGGVRRLDQRILGVVQAAQRPQQLPLRDTPAVERAGPDQVAHERPRQPRAAAEVGEIGERTSSARRQEPRPPRLAQAAEVAQAETERG